MEKLGRRAQAEASRAGLVEAGRECFADKGFEATTVSAVLERAGMARGALYHYFPGGKRELFEAVFASVNESFHAKRDALLALESPLARIRAGLRLFLEQCTQDEFARIALMDAASLIPGQAGRGSTYEMLRVQLSDAISAGEVRGVDAEASAMLLYGAARGAGDFVCGSSNPKAAVEHALAPLERMLDALRGPVS